MGEQYVEFDHTPYFADEAVRLYLGHALDVLHEMPDASVNCCVTSPPYFSQRDYGFEGQYGMEDSPAEFVENLRVLFAEVRRVLADDGTLWLNLGDTYYSGRGAPVGGDAKQAGRRSQGWVRAVDRGGQPWARPKSLLGVPWRTAISLADDGWILRNELIWRKQNPLPEPTARDRLSGCHEHVFMFAKSRFYWFDKAAAPAPRDVWDLTSQPLRGEHYAVMPLALAEGAVAAGCKPGGVVLDPFSGSGTTGRAALNTGRRYVGIDGSAEYLDLSLRTRFAQSEVEVSA